MALVDLFSLFNIAEGMLSNFIKLLGPIVILLVLFIIIKWIQMLNKASNPDIVVLRAPS